MTSKGVYAVKANFSPMKELAQAVMPITRARWGMHFCMFKFMVRYAVILICLSCSSVT